MKNSQLKEVFNRYLENRCTADEVEALFHYFNTYSEPYLRELIVAELYDEQNSDDQALEILAENVFLNIQRQVTGDVVELTNRRKLQLWVRVAAAACLLFVLGVSIYLAINSNVPPVRHLTKNIVVHDIAPGGNKAVLILGNGKQINLTNAQNGRLANEANTVVQKTADGKIVYKSDSSKRTTEITYNTLKTPRGGKFDLTLADGTRVWLNSASSITYPSAFNGNDRQVEITGEAYFEVVHNTAAPFRVRVAGQTIEDLGTHFNINAYTDEPAIKTTLVEGSVRVYNPNGEVTLKPGQQAVIASNQTIVLEKEADTDEAIAWHRGLFEFHDASIETVMRQLARWYDVDVTYEGKIPQRQFSGKIYRTTSALKVSDILSYKQIHFRLEAHKIIVMP